MFVVLLEGYELGITSNPMKNQLNYQDVKTSMVRWRTLRFNYLSNCVVQYVKSMVEIESVGTNGTILVGSSLMIARCLHIYQYCTMQ